MFSSVWKLVDFFLSSSFWNFAAVSFDMGFFIHRDPQFRSFQSKNVCPSFLRNFLELFYYFFSIFSFSNSHYSDIKSLELIFQYFYLSFPISISLSFCSVFWEISSHLPSNSFILLFKHFCLLLISKNSLVILYSLNVPFIRALWIRSFISPRLLMIIFKSFLHLHGHTIFLFVCFVVSVSWKKCSSDDWRPVVRQVTIKSLNVD